MRDGARNTRLVRGGQERESWKLKGEDGKEVVPEAGKNFVLVPPPLLIPRAPITITVGGRGGAGLAAAQDDSPAEGAEGEPEAPAPLKESSFVGQGKVLYPLFFSLSICVFSPNKIWWDQALLLSKVDGFVPHTQNVNLLMARDSGAGTGRGCGEAQGGDESQQG